MGLCLNGPPPRPLRGEINRRQGPKVTFPSYARDLQGSALGRSVVT